MLKNWTVAVGCVLVLACGGEAPAPKTPEPAASVAPVPAAPPVRTPSADVAKYWKLPAAQPIAAYADLASLLHTELMTGLLPEVLQLMQEQLKGTERACVSVVLEHAHELLIGGDAEHGLIVLALGPEGVKAARTACVGSVLPVKRATVAGSEEAYQLGEQGVLALEPAAAVLGSQAFVEAALASGSKPTPLPATLALSGDQHVAVDVSSGGVRVTGHLVASNERFGFDARVEMPSEELAAKIERQISGGRAQATTMVEQQPNGAALRKMLDAVRIERRGKAFDVAFETRGTPVQQAQDIGMLAGLGFHAAMRYMERSKSAEARLTLGEIAKRYSAQLAPDTKTKGPKRLTSLPPVPATVPRGVKYQSSPEDWKAWAPIAFSLGEEQRYQYEVVAAKDGKSAEIRAKGDLDGDGVTSLYVLKITLDPKTGLVQAQGLDETEPFE
jgi:hypothetical protein